MPFSSSIVSTGRPRSRFAVAMLWASGYVISVLAFTRQISLLGLVVLAMACILFPAELAQASSLTNLSSLSIHSGSDSSPALAEDGTIYFGSQDGRF